MSDRHTTPTSLARILPSTPSALATELATLLERLGVEAVILTPEGQPLAQTAGAQVAFDGLTPQQIRQVDTQVCGQRVRVAMAQVGARATALDLTPRQRVVVEMIAEGLRNREIAERLGISLHTVRRHVEALLRRLGVPTRAAAASLLQRTAALSGRLPMRAA